MSPKDASLEMQMTVYANDGSTCASERMEDSVFLPLSGTRTSGGMESDGRKASGKSLTDCLNTKYLGGILG